MSTESIAVIMVVISFALILILGKKEDVIQEWHYNSNSHVMCIIVNAKKPKDLYFIRIHGIWYNYPNGTIATKYWNEVCNNLLYGRRPM